MRDRKAGSWAVHPVATRKEPIELAKAAGLV